MKVLSFNILADQYIDYEDLQRDYPTIHESDLKLEKRMPKIISYIKSVDADIVMLQEITPETKKIISAAFPEYKCVALAKHKYSEGGSYNSGNMTMLRKGMFKNIKHKGLFLAKTPNVFSLTTCNLVDAKQSKAKRSEAKRSEDVSKAKRSEAKQNEAKRSEAKQNEAKRSEAKRSEDDDNSLTIVNVHLDWEFESIREREAIALNKYVAKRKKCIIAGDFNTNAATTHGKFKNLASVVKKEKSTFLCENAMIDYIYVRNFKIKSGDVDNIPVKDKKNCFVKTIKKYGSDHYPVIATLD